KISNLMVGTIFCHSFNKCMSLAYSPTKPSMPTRGSINGKSTITVATAAAQVIAHPTLQNMPL
ncbi:MAG TPA: hypothetical protein VJ695_00130, partial [Nitrososphaera sp.]|nr:hypothetical protein [Nitrososphaera sp.]